MPNVRVENGKEIVYNRYDNLMIKYSNFIFEIFFALYKNFRKISFIIYYYNLFLICVCISFIVFIV